MGWGGGRVSDLVAVWPLGHRVWVEEKATLEGPGLQGPDKDACQRKAGEGKTFANPKGGKAREAAPGPKNNGYLTSVGH